MPRSSSATIPSFAASRSLWAGHAERGVVAAASYEARKFGVHSAMPSVTAKRKCPELIFVMPRFDIYKAVSRQIREIFAEHTPLIEPLSLDEAYLDVTENLQGIASATEIAEQIGRKSASRPGSRRPPAFRITSSWPRWPPGERKPDGLFVITPKDGRGLRRKPAGRQVSRDRSR